MKKNIKHLFFIFLLLLLAVGFLFSNKKKNTLNLFFTDESKYFLIIPMEIQDKTYYFFWDAGAANSFIKPDFIDSLNLNKDLDSVFRGFRAMDKESIEDTFHIKKIDCKLGSFDLSIPFFIDSKEFIPHFTGSEVVGLIGQNVISKYNWSFDLNKWQVRIVNKNRTLSYYKTNSSLKIPFYISSMGGNACVDLLINNVEFKKVVFDTGFRYLGKIPIENQSYKIYPSIRINANIADSIFPKEMSIGFEKENKDGLMKFLLCDSIHFNEFRMANISIASHIQDANYITTNFIFQFEKMYYDSRNQEVTLINYRGDTHPTGDEKELIQYINESRRE